MRKVITFVLAFVLALSSVFFAGQTGVAEAKAPKATEKGAKILAFDSMVGNTASFTGAMNPIRGIDGGGLPWALTSAHGFLTASGHLKIVVKSLVLASGSLAGTNPVSSFRAIVSCMTSTGSIVNVMTGAFPATTGMASAHGGNARINTMVNLPQPCIAPIIFVTSPSGAWFAATGN